MLLTLQFPFRNLTDVCSTHFNLKLISWNIYDRWTSEFIHTRRSPCLRKNRRMAAWQMLHVNIAEVSSETPINNFFYCTSRENCPKCLRFGKRALLVRTFFRYTHIFCVPKLIDHIKILRISEKKKMFVFHDLLMNSPGMLSKSAPYWCE